MKVAFAALAPLPDDLEQCRPEALVHAGTWERRYCAFLENEAAWKAYVSMQPCVPSSLVCEALDVKKNARDELATKYAEGLRMAPHGRGWQLTEAPSSEAAFWGAASLCRAAEVLLNHVEFLEQMFPYEPLLHPFHDPPWLMNEVVRAQAVQVLDDVDAFARANNVANAWTDRCAALSSTTKAKLHVEEGAR